MYSPRHSFRLSDSVVFELAEEIVAGAGFDGLVGGLGAVLLSGRVRLKRRKLWKCADETAERQRRLSEGSRETAARGRERETSSNIRRALRHFCHVSTLSTLRTLIDPKSAARNCGAFLWEYALPEGHRRRRIRRPVGSLCEAKLLKRCR